MTADQLKDVFRADVPEGFLYDAVSLFHWVYPNAHKRVYGFHGPIEARDLLGHERRAMVEENLKEIARRYPGMSASSQRNRKNTQSYTEIRSGRVILTSSCLHYPQDSLRQADFRNQYIRTMQHSITQIQEDTVIEDGPVFAVLVHGPTSDGMLKLNYAELGFAFAGFPTENFRSWQTSIELMHAYTRPLVVGNTEVEAIEDQIRLNIIRPKEDEGKSGAGA